MNIREKILFFILFISCLFWFLKVPVYRYGYSYIVSMISFIFAHYMSKNMISKKRYNNFIYSLIFLGLFAFATKNFIRIFYHDANYNNYPWPKFYSHNDSNNKPDLKVEIINGKKIYTSGDGYCMYSLAPCTGFEIDINVQKNKNYYYFIKK